jgi:hypothetical protein
MIVLEAIQSPFIRSFNNTINVDDLVSAIRICSTNSWQEATEEPSFFLKLKFNKLLLDADALRVAFEQFQLYISESVSCPKTWTKDSESNKKVNNGDENMPSSLSIVVLLMTKFGFSEKEAWDLPFGRAIWYSTAFSSQEGADIKIITTESEDRASEDMKRLEGIEKTAIEDFKQNG